MEPDPDRTDTATRFVPAARAAVWRALIDHVRVARWLPPEGMRGRVDLWEPHVNGRFRLALSYEETEHAAAGKTSPGEDIVEGRFVELIADERMAWTVTFRSDDPAYAGEMLMTWRLADAPDGTEVAIEARNVPPGIGAEDHATGLASTLANLARELA